MPRHLCVHGHFYQPPREDPWLDEILPEGSAAPALHWNERILHESYAPLSRARRMDGNGRITDLVDCYEWISFNFGPTLLSWLERFDPVTYGRLLAADKASIARWGHGNAMAQVCHHAILPLATQLDREAEVAWGVADFTARFGRAPEGMWLSEAAVDTPSLELLAAHGVRFTILSPRQAQAVRPLQEGAQWSPVTEDWLDIRHPYRVNLPSGRHIDVFFYNGPISRAVAFERLLQNGDAFWSRLSSAAGPGLLSVATDGETYGHHFPYGEMALAYVLELARSGRDDIALTNFAAFLAANPPTSEIRIVESSSWSCVHGVERWRTDCGCVTGGHPDWNQKWRAPLREALDTLKATLDAHYFAVGQNLFRDPKAALIAYGEPLAGLTGLDAFADTHLRPSLAPDKRAVALKLLAMQRWALSMFASCAWFFDDIDRIEPVNAMTMALRAIELCRATGGPDPEKSFIRALSKARSNLPSARSGDAVYRDDARPRRESERTLAAQALIGLWTRGRLPQPGESAVVDWPGVRVAIDVNSREPASASGDMRVTWRLESECAPVPWVLEPDPALPDPLALKLKVGGEVSSRPGLTLPANKRLALSAAWAMDAAECLWSRETEAARLGVPLFLPYQPYQTDQTASPAWAALFPGLAWSFVHDASKGLPGHKDLVAFLSRLAAVHPGTPELARRVAAEITRLVEAELPASAATVLALAREIGLAPDLWQAQNLAWDKRGRDATWRELADALGLA